MRNIDLSKYDIHTDLVIDLIEENNKYEKKEEFEGGQIRKINLNKKDAETLNKKEGSYITIHFNDITDKNNFDNVLNALSKSLKEILKDTNIKDDSSCMVIGLGNERSTPDELGVKVSEKVLVTKHIYELTGSLEEGYRIVSSFSPGVMGETGIETSDIISAVINKVKPDFIIAIDALASDSIDRLLKTIQITNTGISPGSGIGNNRKELSKDIYNIPVIAIGVPTVTSATTIVSDTLDYMKKHFSYNIKNKDQKKDKLIPTSNINYLNNNIYNLSKEESSYFMGAIGSLSNYEKKSLINNVLSPIGYNLMVTPKEIDFIIEKLIELISVSINNTLHNISTKNI